jgi:hypothetical protein
VTSEFFDVYLEPLVDEFLQLWEGIPAYDVTKVVGARTFKLCGIYCGQSMIFLGMAQSADLLTKVMRRARGAVQTWVRSTLLS